MIRKIAITTGFVVGFSFGWWLTEEFPSEFDASAMFEQLHNEDCIDCVYYERGEE